MFWIDQPVGVGFSTVDSDGYVKDETDVVNDFMGFLSNLVQIFPSLASRPLYLAGEDYSAIYISYISQALMSSSKPPVQLVNIAIGNGMFGDLPYADLSTMTVLESFPQLVHFDELVYTAFASKSQLCGYSLNVTYPQADAFPPLPSSPRRSTFWSSFQNESQVPGVLYKRSDIQKRQSPSLGNELDPFYGCALFDEMIDYAANWSAPWTVGSFDLYDVSDVLNPKATFDGGIYLNNLQVREALHAPFSKNWTSLNSYPFGSTTNLSSSGNIFGDTSPPPSTFFQDLISSALNKNISIILYSGANNAISSHHSLEILIQNTTFGGTRGFARKPSTPLKDDNGTAVGIVHTERGLTYALFDNVGALVPRAAPNAAFVLFRDFVLDKSQTGTITVDSNGNTAVIGGENSAEAVDAPRVVSELFVGSATTASTIAVPAATLQAWAEFVGGNQTEASASSGRRLSVGQTPLLFVVLGLFCILYLGL